MENTEIRLIQKQFNETLTRTQERMNINDINTDMLFEEWEKNKDYFIKKFGGFRIVSDSKVKYTLTSEAKKVEYYNFMNDMRFPCGTDLGNLGCYLDCVGYEDFFENKIKNGFHCLGNFFEAGQKVLKNFKLFVKDPKRCEEVTQRAAMLIQKNSTEGYMCLSVHPLDFLTLSNNNYNWTSCLSADGAYKGGITSYMCDSSTVIAYIISEDEKEIIHNCGDINWYNKKWRELIYFNKTYDIAVQSKPYPYMLGDEAIDEEIDKLLSRYHFYGFGPSQDWTRQKINLDSCLDEEPLLNLGNCCGTISMKFLMENKGCAYNDITLNTDYMFKYKILNHNIVDACYGVIKPKEILERLAFHTNALAPCTCCGETRKHTYSDTLVCDECLMEGVSDSQDVETCICCGNRADYNDMWDVADGLVCSTCYENDYVRCDRCGEVVEKINAHYKEGEYYCNCCWNELDNGEKI